MDVSHHIIRAANQDSLHNSCLACGTMANMKRRRYCSIDCRQQLRRALNIRTGLLKALNTRYATFYFTEDVIVMDLMPAGSHEIYSYLFRRTPRQKPVDDFRRLANMLGNQWWAEKRRTNRHYLANRFLLNHAQKNHVPNPAVVPEETNIPAVHNRSLIHLKLNRDDLVRAPQLQETIKKAYRLQAKRFHPDIGGDTASFQKIQKAYEEMLAWSENPTFVRRRGFPDKWFYDGNTNRWVQPTPFPNSASLR